MPTINLTTGINAPQPIVFDLARSIHFHQLTTHKTNEKAIAGRTKGLIQLGETVTWRAKHLGIYQTLTSKITEMELYSNFTDEMEEGIFESIKHQHLFELKNGKTVMTDNFHYTSPLGILGKLADSLFLKQYLTAFLLRRNSLIKEHAEKENISIKVE